MQGNNNKNIIVNVKIFFAFTAVDGGCLCMKKSLTVVCAAVISVLSVSAAFAASEYTVSDFKGLCEVMFGKAAAEKKHDINDDGVTDILDVISLRSRLGSTGEYRDMTIKATEENVKFTGRNYTDSNGVTWLVHSGSAVEFSVNAKSAEVTVIADSGINSEEKYRPRYAVIVDGEIIKDCVVSEKTETVKLFSSETPRNASVKIIHLSEANNGTVGVGDIRVNSDAAVPVTPAGKKKLSIEFIGDSITCAYGVEAESQYVGFSTGTENFMKSYAYLTAQKLDADYSAVSYSGHGIISGYTSSEEKNTESLVPDVYTLTGKPKDYASEWDFKNHKYDVVVINLGTNDSSFVSHNFEKYSPEFTEKYAEFLETVHEKNPDAYIICTLGTMGCTELCPCIDEAVGIFRKNTGYDRIMSYQSATHTQADGMGADWHPSEKTQQNSAYVLADKICQALGMESDQLGLDVAADAVYTSEHSDGANMSAYFSDWDKSFHITTVSGGADRNAIKAMISGIGLKKGGKYRLEFKCETGKDEEIPFSLRSTGGSEVYFKDVFTGTGSKTEFSTEFVSSGTDDTVLEFLMGGTDNLRLSLYDVKVTRIG